MFILLLFGCTKISTIDIKSDNNFINIINYTIINSFHNAHHVNYTYPLYTNYNL